MKKLITLGMLLLLVACGGSDKKPDTSKDDAAKKKPEITTDNLICPQVAILQEAQEVFDYGGEQADAAQLVSKARLKKIDGDCAYRVDEKKGGIDVAFTLTVVAARGPRLGGNQVSFPYFVAVIDPAENILNRQLITAQFKFSSSKSVVEIEEPLHVFIPLPETSLQAGPSYRVLIGFQKPITGD